jgi:TonB family protein
MLSLALLLLSFIQAGTISGRLLQADGKPAVGVRVAAVEATADAAQRQDRLSMMSVTQTDSSGRYKLENVPPGKYYIQAGAIGASSYLPGTGDIAKATVVAVTGSAPILNLDFSFVQWSNLLKTSRTSGPGDTARFSGKLRAASSASSLQNVVVFLTNIQSAARFLSSTDKEGAFEFSDLPAGEYSVELFSPIDSGFNRGGYEQFRSSIVLNRGEALSEEIQLRLYMAAATARQRPDWYTPGPPRAGGASISASMALATQRILELVPPVYPDSARRANLKATMVFEILIGKDGALRAARIQSGSAEPVLVRAAVEVLPRARFQPFVPNGESLEFRTTVSFNFPPE